jgi:hypothetical protein
MAQDKRIGILGASVPAGLCCKEKVIKHLHTEMGASLRRRDRAFRLYLFRLRQKRIPLQSLARPGLDQPERYRL